MNTSSDARNPVELLAEEFLDRKRRGERPTLQEYLDRYPALAADIRDLFPALLMVEDLGASSGATTGSLAAANGSAVGIRLQRLGDYRILREIGRGGMGIVYEAEQESLGRRVALKVLPAGSLLDPKQVRRFEREARAAARLHHTNIVPVFGVGRQDGHHYFVMQFIAGLGLDVVLDDLRHLRQAKSGVSPAAEPAPSASRVAGLTGAEVARSLITGRIAADGPPKDGSVTEPFNDADPAAAPIAANGPSADGDSSSAVLPGSSELSASSDPDRQFYRSIARIGVQVAEALEYANRQGILHRDVKPSNLLLDNHGNVWVADFGLAKTAEADDLTHTGDILGTIRYMAPERFSGHCDARSDVYSLGLTLYELVALRPAYAAADRHLLIERVLHEEPERLKRLAPSVPRDLETIIAKAIARDPVARYATATALGEDLQRYVEDLPIRARRISPAERSMRWCRRNQRLAAAIGVAAVALVTALVLALLYAEDQNHLANDQALRVAEQTEATNKITRLADDLERRSKALESSLAESNSRLARLDLERGQAAFEKGQVGRGMLWTVESLRLATAAGDEAGRHVALANLSAWRRHLVELKEVLSYGDSTSLFAFSPDGKTILTGRPDGMARLWDFASGRPVGQAMVHQSHVFPVAFSPDGKTIVSGDYSVAQQWDATSGRPVGQPLKHSGFVYSVAFRPDSKIILTGCQDKTAQLWDAASGRPVGQPLEHSGMVYAVAFSPDGNTILTGCTDNKVRLWDAASGRPLDPPLTNSGPVYAVAFSRDGKTLLAACLDRTVRLWDAATRRQLGPTLEQSVEVTCVAFRPDGKTILTALDATTAQLWDAATGQRIGRPLEHQGRLDDVAFRPDDGSILTCGQDGTARLWDGEFRQPVGRLLEYGSHVSCVAFRPDGKTLLTAGIDGKVRLWDVASGQLLGWPVEQRSEISALTSSPDGKTFLTGSSKTAQLWDATSGRPVGQPMEHSGSVRCVAFSPDGKTIVTESIDRMARLWDAASGRPAGQPMKHSGVERSSYASCLAFSPDGRAILTEGRDKTAQLWDAATGQPLGTPVEHSGNVYSVAFGPDGKTILTGSEDRTAQLWDAATGRPLGPPMPHSGMVYSVAFSPDGKTILTGGHDRRAHDKTAQLWDAATGQPIGPPMPHPSSGQSWEFTVAFSPDSRFLLTSDSDTARLWDTPAPLPEDVPRLAAWVETATGLELDERGSIRVLARAAWLERRRRLDQLGGPPPADRATRLDPIHFGADPAAQGDALKERGLWDRAEAAYAEAARARPLNRSIWEALARLHAERGQLDRAAATLTEAIRLMPDDPELRIDLSRALLWAGDWAAWRSSNAALLDRFGGTSNAETARRVAWACVLGPEGTADAEVPVRLAEAGVKDATESNKLIHLSTLGAALYRAGRFDDAIRRITEGSRREGRVTRPQDWAFLAMAHHRQGHRDEAFRWLDRLRNHQPSAAPTQFWRELEIRLLRSEAEAVILDDPVFPADPFAH